MLAALAVLALIESIVLEPSAYVTVSTGDARYCNDERPENEFGLPACDEFDSDGVLIEALDRDDSARALLEKRYLDADTFFEKHRIAAALLEHVKQDRAYWDELVRHAEVIVRRPRDGEEEYSDAFLEWCEARALDPHVYSFIAESAFLRIATEPRAKTLTLSALETNDASLVEIAILGLAEQHAIDTLPAVERALTRLGEDAAPLVQHLAYFECDEADAIALKFLSDDEDRARYDTIRGAMAEARVTP